MSMFSVIV